jgi:hypothetical protein
MPSAQDDTGSVKVFVHDKFAALITLAVRQSPAATWTALKGEDDATTG